MELSLELYDLGWKLSLKLYDVGCELSLNLNDIIVEIKSETVGGWELSLKGMDKICVARRLVTQYCSAIAYYADCTAQEPVVSVVCTVVSVNILYKPKE